MGEIKLMKLFIRNLCSRFCSPISLSLLLGVVWLSPDCSSSSKCSSDLEFHWPIFHLVSVALWHSLNAALIDLYQRWLGQNQQSVCLGVNPHLRLALLDPRPIDREITNENAWKWIDECVISNTFIYFSFSFVLSRFIASEVCLLLHLRY